MTPTLAAVSCTNGLGHSRRMVAVIDRLLAKSSNLQIELFGSSKILKKFSSWSPWIRAIGTGRLHFSELNFPSLMSLDSKDLDIIELSQRLPTFKHDIVWSDNLVEVLCSRPDSLLSGSFFWHDNISFCHHGKRYVDDCTELLSKCEPCIIGNYLLSTPHVRAQKNFFPVGFYKYFKNINNVPKEKSVLFYFGDNTELEKQFIDFDWEAFSRDNKARLYAKASLATRVKGVDSFDFSGKSFTSVTDVVALPGMGIMSDALNARANLFLINSKNNYEFSSNITSMASIGLAIKIDALKYFHFNFQKLSNDTKKFSKKINFDGVNKTANRVLGAVNNLSYAI